MGDKFVEVLIHNTQNYHFRILLLVVETFGYSTYEPTNQNSIKVAKVVNPSNSKTFL